MSDSKDEKGEEEKVYGGCEGPDAMYVKLVSSDGHEFIVKRDHALTSGTIKAMLSGPGMLSIISTGNAILCTFTQFMYRWLNQLDFWYKLIKWTTEILFNTTSILTNNVQNNFSEPLISCFLWEFMPS